MTNIRAEAVTGVGAAIVAVLLPKCPVCVAAYLMALGLGAGASHGAAPLVRPVAFTVAAVAGLMLVVGVWRRRRRCCRR